MNLPAFVYCLFFEMIRSNKLINLMRYIEMGAWRVIALVVDVNILADVNKGISSPK